MKLNQKTAERAARRPRYFESPPSLPSSIDVGPEQAAHAAFTGQRIGASFSVSDLLAERSEQPPPSLRVTPLQFRGVGDQDVTNPSAIFDFQGHRAMFAIAQSRSRDIHDAEIRAFVEEDPGSGVMSPLPGGLVLPGHDATLSRFETDGRTTYVLGTVGREPRFPRGIQTFHVLSDDFSEAEPLFQSPPGERSNRIFQLRDGVGVLTRPKSIGAINKGAEGPGGSIGFARVGSLLDLSTEVIADAPLIPEQLHSQDWWGPNDARLLPDGRVLVLLHVAERQPGKSDYYPALATFDPVSRHIDEIVVPYTKEDLRIDGARKNIVFAGGFSPEDLRSATVGVADTHAAIVQMEESPQGSGDWLTSVLSA